MHKHNDIEIRYIDDLLTADEDKQLKGLESNSVTEKERLEIEVAFLRIVLKDRNRALNASRWNLKKMQKRIEQLSQMSFYF